MNTYVRTRKYPVNNSDNIFGDYCALVEIETSDGVSFSRHSFLLSAKGKDPKILTEQEALVAKANFFYIHEN